MDNNIKLLLGITDPNLTIDPKYLNINILRILEKKLLKIVRLCSDIYIYLTLCIALIVRL